MTGITGYGVHIPRYHVTATEYGNAVGRYQGRIDQKVVAPYDEDAATMGIDAARDLTLGDPELVALATTNPPQPGTVAAGVVTTALGLSGNRRTLEFGSSWRAGMDALSTGLDTSSALVVASDDPRAPHEDPADHVLGAGAAAFTLGETDPLAEHITSAHYVDAHLPSKFGDAEVTDLQLGQYTAEGFEEAVGKVVSAVLSSTGFATSEIDHVVLPQDDVKTAWRTGTGLGFETDQLSTGFLVKRTGFTGAAMPLLGLAAVLDASEPAERILVLGYGYGHGADAILFETTDLVPDADSGLEAQLERTESISYDRYRNLTRRDN